MDSVPLADRWGADDGTEWTSIVRDLLPFLARREPDWAVLKNHARLPAVSGDIDLCVPRSRWDRFLEAYLKALARRGRFAVVTCDHHRVARFTFAVPLGVHRVARSLQIDLIDGINWKATVLLSGWDTLANGLSDERGFRRIRPGAEAACQLTANAIRRRGTLDTTNVGRKAILDKARQDADAFSAAMTAMHGRIGGVAAQRFLTGDWAAWVGLALSGRRALRAVPQLTPGARMATFAWRKLQLHWREFPRVVDGSPEAWLERVARRHPYHLVGV